MRRLAVTLGVLGVASLQGASCGAPQKTQTYVAAPESWCPDGFEQGSEDACFALPEQKGEKTAVLIYMHDAYKGAGPKEEWDLVKRAMEKGFAIVLVRGRRALCGLSGAEQQSEFCWPTDPEDPQTMKQMVAGWDKTIWQADALLENGPHKHYVLGYGTGGAFVGTLATQGFIEASGFGIIGAGASIATPAAGRKPVFVVVEAGDADGDGGTQAKALGDALTKANWAYAKCPHAQHALTGADLDVVLKDFSRERAGEISSFPSAGASAGTPCEPPASTAPPTKKKQK